MLELNEVSRGLCLFFCAAVATGAWCSGLWCVWRGFQALPDGTADLPFFSDDPRLITREGRTWRKRVYLCAGYFLAAVALAWMFHLNG